MNVDYPQANCNTCGSSPAEIELVEPEPLFYDDDTVFVLLVILWCARCRQHQIYFDAD